MEVNIVELREELDFLKCLPAKKKVLIATCTFTERQYRKTRDRLIKKGRILLSYREWVRANALQFKPFEDALYGIIERGKKYKSDALDLYMGNSDYCLKLEGDELCFASSNITQGLKLSPICL